MLTYLATYRLRAADATGSYEISGPAPTVSVTIQDFGLQHAAARAWWRLPTVAASQGWHPDVTELVSVELVADEEPTTAPRGRAWRVAKDLCGCDNEARRLVAAAAVVAGATL
jgi:hypothetical protein